MNEILNIVREDHPGHILLKVEGRIDGYWSKQLEEYLENMLRSGNYNVALDLTGVNYMSSLGIRILMKYKKLYGQVNGSFGILDASENVVSLLEMAGLNTILRWQIREIPAPAESLSETIESGGFKFKIKPLDGQRRMECYFSGNPEKLRTGSYKSSDCISVSFGRNHYGIGLGAIGSDFGDCKNRFGEFIALGDAVVYSPAGQPNNPDYMLKSGALVPRIELLYGVIFNGEFDSVISFSSDEADKTISMGQLLGQLFEITGMERFVMVMLAEASGLVGVSLNQSPADESKSDLNPFIYPGIKENINFTTGPEYKQMMTLTAGIACKTTDGDVERFTRCLAPGSPIYQHFHSAIFSYHPLKKTDIDLDDTVTAFFDQDKIREVLHLINDTREINGIGESDFRGGVCWMASIDSPIKTKER
jgi:anti-anti-sigma factor